MNKTRIIVGAALIVGAAGGAWWLYYSSTEQALRRACVSVLSERLRSPASLDVKVWHDLRRRPATKDEAVGPEPEAANYPPEMLGTFQQVYNLRERWFIENAPDVLLLPFEYGASNGFGVPIRGYSECSYVTDKHGAWASVIRSSVKIDTLSHLEWVNEQIRIR